TDQSGTNQYVEKARGDPLFEFVVGRRLLAHEEGFYRDGRLLSEPRGSGVREEVSRLRRGATPPGHQATWTRFQWRPRRHVRKLDPGLARDAGWGLRLRGGRGAAGLPPRPRGPRAARPRTPE